MPRFNPRNNDFTDGLADDFDDGFDDDFDDLEDLDELTGAADPFSAGDYLQDDPWSSAGDRRPEEWERYLDRMDPGPDRRRGGGQRQRYVPSGRPEPGRDRYRDFDRPDPIRGLERPERREPRRAPADDRWDHDRSQQFGESRERRKRGTAGLAIMLLLLLAAGVGAYVWFYTDLYYVAAVKLESTRMDMFVGEDMTIAHELTVFGSGTPGMEWSSTDPAVASVDAQGAVSALTAGEATITLLDPASGNSAQCAVSVHAVNEMVLGADELTLGAGETFAMFVQTGAHSSEQPAFVSADSNIAAVDSAGRVSALEPGETDITVSARGFNDVSFHVTVMQAPTVISPSDASGGMCKGETRRLTVQPGEGEYSSEYSYTSDAPSVVSIDESGLMTAAGEGSANITVSVYNGVSCTVPVTVGKEAGAVTVPKKLTAYNGLPLAVGAEDSTGNCRQFFYSSSDPEIVQVDEQGYIHALKSGTATVTCTSYNGNSAKCKVTARIVDHTTPYTSRRVRENIAALAATYPELISYESIGTSVQGRDITLLKLGTGERKVLVVAGMHSRENIAVTFTMRCIEEYAQAASEGKRYSSKYNVKKMLGEFTIYFVPLLNPDGLDIVMGLAQPEYTDQPLTEEEIAEFKNTANGVNLNRNFPFEWGHEKVNTTTPDGRSYAGASAASEPETQAIIDLCARHEFEWLLDMHCKGHLIYYQDKVTGTNEATDKLARKLYNRCDFTLTDQSTLQEISGGLENWFRKEYGKPGICVELVGSKYSPAVNQYFETKLDWKRTRGVFLMCLED